MCHNSLYRLSSNYGMNTQSLVAHKKLLAIMIGVAIFATAGMGAAYAQMSIQQTQNPQSLVQSILNNTNVKSDS